MILLEINSKKNGKHTIFIDGEDFDKIKNYTWCVHKEGEIYYAITSIKSNNANSKRRSIVRMHRLLIDPKKGFHIDHIDHNGLNNCKDNLRICTCSQNSMNSRKRKNRTSIFKGVSLCKNGKYKAQIMINYKQKNLGFYDNETVCGYLEHLDTAAED